MADRQITIPPGCQGVEVGGRTYRGRGPNGGGYVSVPEEHANLIGSVDTGGILSGALRVTAATRPGRKCAGCGRRWYKWARSCPSCGAPTVPE